jgi:hypothetical protein
MEIHTHEPEPRKTGHHLVDLVISVCALLISAISIFMAYHTGHNMERLVHASSWPALQLGSGNASEHGQAISFSLQNAGIGPARIHSFEYVVDDATNRDAAAPRKDPVVIKSGYLLAQIAAACCPQAWKEAMARAQGDTHGAVGDTSSRPIARSFLSPKEETTALRWPRTEANTALWRVLDDARFAGFIRMRACYCSVFDECWIVETNQFPPRPVASCPASEP